MIRRIAAQARVELTLTIRRGEALLVTIGIPVGLLVFFSAVPVLPHGNVHPVEFLVPGVLALAIISTSMVSLGIATGFERQAGVLKRLGATPLGRGGLLAAKTASVLVIEVVQVAAIAGAGLALGWHARGSLFAAAALLVGGTIAFAGIGLALAGRLRAEANLAAANGGFLVLLMLGGIMVPVARLPGPLRLAARALPAEPLATSMRAVLAGGAVPAGRAVALAAWAVAAVVVAAFSFRWE